jgi:hypothetical protein
MLSWVFAGAGCATSLSLPGETTRITGTVEAADAAPVLVAVYERCSPRLYLFERCPGKFLGEAKIARPGPFLVEVDAAAIEVSVVAYRGDIGEDEQIQPEECAAFSGPAASARSLELRLERRRCPFVLPMR